MGGDAQASPMEVGDQPRTMAWGLTALSRWSGGWDALFGTAVVTAFVIYLAIKIGRCHPKS